MDQIKPLSDFFFAIAKDARISTTHIGIYAALLQYWQEHDCNNPIKKISAQRTYHRRVKDLNEYGYIRYEPSFKRNSPSKVYLFYQERP
jgi:hypothetical protein